MKMALERDLDRPLQGASASDAVHTALATAEGGGDLTEVRGRNAGAVGLPELRCIAQLEGVKSRLQSHFTVECEFLEDREVVLNVSRTGELISAGVAETRICAWCRCTARRL